MIASFVIGLVVGACIGVLMMALAVAAGRSDEKAGRNDPLR